MPQKTRKVLLEFFPEIVLHPIGSIQNNSKKRVSVFQSKDSLRMWSFGRYLKWRFNQEVSREELMKTNTILIMIRKYTRLKGYRLGKKVAIRTLPALIIDNKFLCEGKLPPRNELKEIVNKFLVSI